MAMPAPGILAHGGVILVGGFVPGDVHGNRRRDAGHLVHHGGVVELLLRGVAAPGQAKALKARAAVGIAPTGRFDMLAFERSLDRLDIDCLRLELECRSK
jgi:hypothetical protein